MTDIVDPIILEPADLTPEAGWAECKDYVDKCGGLQHDDGDVNWRAAIGAMAKPIRGSALLERKAKRTAVVSHEEPFHDRIDAADHVQSTGARVTRGVHRARILRRRREER